MVARAFAAVFLTMGALEFLLVGYAILMIASIRSAKVRNFIGFSIREGSTPLFGTIAAHGVVSMIFAILGAFPNLKENPSESECFWSYKFATISYAFVVLGFFTFLYIKCQSTNLQGEIAKHWIDNLVHLLLLSFPFISTILFTIANRGQVYHHQETAFDGSTGDYCMLKTENWIVVLLIVFDSGMNIMFTYMFYRPLAEIIESSKNVRNQDESHVKRRLILRKILRETLLTSFIGMAFNFLAVLILYLNEVYKLAEDYNFSWMQWLPCFVPIVNSCIMLFAVRRGYEKVISESHVSSKPVSAAEVKSRRTSSSIKGSDQELSPKNVVDGFKTFAA
jgi:hypothetical protein